MNQTVTNSAENQMWTINHYKKEQADVLFSILQTAEKVSDEAGKLRAMARKYDHFSLRLAEARERLEMVESYKLVDETFLTDLDTPTTPAYDNAQAIAKSIRESRKQKQNELLRELSQASNN